MFQGGVVPNGVSPFSEEKERGNEGKICKGRTGRTGDGGQPSLERNCVRSFMGSLTPESYLVTLSSCDFPQMVISLSSLLPCLYSMKFLALQKSRLAASISHHYKCCKCLSVLG